MASSVLTLHPGDFRTACRDLSQLVTESGFHPDCVIAIREGGVHVVEAMDLAAVPMSVSVGMKRRTTQAKKESKLLRLVADKAPYSLLNVLRLIEDRVLISRSRRAKNSQSPEDVEFLRTELQNLLSLLKTRTSILIVDDAVDSGRTLAAVVAEVRRVTEATVLSAVLTVTRAEKHVELMPDYTLYSRVLLRFPWSLDYKR